MTNVINQEVSVNAFYFAGQGMKTFPREIEYGGQAITFANGLRYLVQRGAEAVKLFDMSGADGLVYRLQQQDEHWTLLATKGAF
ncbi:MAG TPA: hypothetical protein VGM08_01635 [Candidatus Saccharimonadales bacterium]|jgi:hypothetical protein